MHSPDRDAKLRGKLLEGFAFGLELPYGIVAFGVLLVREAVTFLSSENLG